MNWLKKLLTIGMNSVNEAGEKTVDNLVDIRREGNGILNALDKDIKTIKTRVEDAQTTVNIAKSDIEANNKRIDTYQTIAGKAVDAGNDEDALEALAHVEAIELENVGHQDTVDMLEPLVKEQLAVVKSMQSERDQIKNELVRLDIQEKTYKARMKLLGGSEGGVAFDIEDLRSRVKRAKAQVEAKEMVNKSSNNDLVKKYDESISRTSAKERLEALKSSKDVSKGKKSS